MVSLLYIFDNEAWQQNTYHVMLLQEDPSFDTPEGWLRCDWLFPSSVMLLGNSNP